MLNLPASEVHTARHSRQGMDHITSPKGQGWGLENLAVAWDVSLSLLLLLRPHAVAPMRRGNSALAVAGPSPPPADGKSPSRVWPWGQPSLGRP